MKASIALASLHKSSLAIAVVLALCGTAALNASAAGAIAAGPNASPFTVVAQPTRLHPGDAVIGALPMSQSIHITVALKIRDREGLDALLAGNAKNAALGIAPQLLTSAEVMAQHAPTQAQAQAVADYLTRSGFTNIVIAPNRLLVSADGNALSARNAFMTTFAQVKTRDGRIAFANTDVVRIPTALQDNVLAVLGLQNVHQPHAIAGDARGTGMKDSNDHTPTTRGFNPLQFSSIYGGADVGTAQGVVVGIISAGNVTQTITDLNSFTTDNGLPTVKTQTINTDGTFNGDYGVGEWDIDSQAIVGMAGGEIGRIVFYDIPDLADPHLTADFNTAVTDNQAKIINVSIGFCETDEKNDGAAAADDQIFALADAQGQTFSIAAGDTGADECGNGTIVGALYPGASPYVVAVAGTSLTGSATAWTSEVVWNDLALNYGATGGSLSTFEPKPAWQDSVLPSATTRGVADVAFDADPYTGEHLITYGQLLQRGGTSLATPIFTGLWARVIAARGTSVGFAAPLIYALPSTDFHDITVGNNDGSTAAVGYDLASGRGSMIVGNAIADMGGIGDTPPVANFGYSTTGFTTRFTDTSTDSDGSVVAHTWQFGDGTTGTGANPSHTYTAAGIYNVSETVKDNHSANSISTQPVTIGALQLLGNSGFETGTAAPWNITPKVLLNNSMRAHTGKWFAEIGNGAPGPDTDHVAQSVTIPSGKTSATLSFYLNISTTDLYVADDRLYVKVYSAAGVQLATLATYSNLNASGLYVLHNLDMTPYIGQKVQIDFVGINNATDETKWDLDDVTLNVE